MEERLAETDVHVDDGCAARKSANFCLHCFHRSLLLGRLLWAPYPSDSRLPCARHFGPY